MTAPEHKVLLKHIRLDALVAGQEGLHLLTTLLSVCILFYLSPLPLLQHTLLQRNHPSGTEFSVAPSMVFLNYTMVVVFLVALWFLHRGQTRFILLIAVTFTIFYSSGVMGNVREWDYVYRKYAFSWVSVAAYACSFLLLSVFAWQITRTSKVGRVSPEDRSCLPASAHQEVSLKRFFLRLFGIPLIILWLPQRWQRWTAGTLFFLQMCAFAVFVPLILFSLLLYFPLFAQSLAFFAPCFEPDKTSYKCWILLPLSPFALWAMQSAPVIGVIVLVALLRFSARYFTRTSLENLISKDQRPTILFLRSFRDDQVKLQKPRHGIVMRMVSFGEPRPTLDHILLEEGSPHGPVVALGAPGKFRPFGAARTYVSNEEWRETVMEFCRQSGMVFVTVDETEGVRWEVQHILAEKHLPKTLFLLPPRLIGSEEVARVLPVILTQSGEPDPEWIWNLVYLLRTEQQYCIGWFWRSEQEIAVLTAGRNSDLAYAVGVRIFCSFLRPT